MAAPRPGRILYALEKLDRRKSGRAVFGSVGSEISTKLQHRGSATYRRRLLSAMSAFGGKADITQTSENVRF
jgi:hypothetical protein